MFSFLLFLLFSSKPSMYSSSFSVQYFHFQLKNQSRLNKTVELRGCDMLIFLSQFCDLDNAIRQFWGFFFFLIQLHLTTCFLFVCLLFVFFFSRVQSLILQLRLFWDALESRPAWNTWRSSTSSPQGWDDRIHLALGYLVLVRQQLVFTITDILLSLLTVRDSPLKSPDCLLITGWALAAILEKIRQVTYMSTDVSS